MPETLLREESRVLSERRTRLESERAGLPSLDRPTWDINAIEARLPTGLKAIRGVLASAEGDDFALMLRAVDAQISASRQEVEIRGAIPLIESSDYADLITTERTSA